MSDEETNPDSTAPEIALGASLLQKAQERRDAQDDLLTLDIPSWSGELRAKYRVLPRSELDSMLRSLRRRQIDSSIKKPAQAEASSDDAIQTDVNFLVNACVGIYAYDLENESEFKVTDGYDQQLTTMLGQDFGRAVELVLYVFKHNGIALAAHAQKVATWMKDTTAELDPQ